MKKPDRRRTYFVSWEVQGKLAYRVVLYWCACIFAIIGLLVGVPMLVATFTGAEQGVLALLVHIWRQFWPALIASMVILPLVILDVVLLSHRFVGPILRIRNDMKRLAKGVDVNPIELRQGDAWEDVASAFNELAAELRELRSQQTTELAEPRDEIESAESCEATAV